MGRWLIIIGIVLIVIGVILIYAPGLVNWFGKLPGDIKIASERSNFFIPITSMIVVSVVLSIIINLIKRFIN